jgi:hypothetical protein
MVKRKENPWQFKFSLALAILMLFLVFGYFAQSFLEIRKVKPVSVAIERLSETSTESDVSQPIAPAVEAENKEAPNQ